MNLYLDWCSYEATKYAVMHWHYSKKMPLFKLVKIGAWEDSRFIGVVIFSCDACPSLGSPYGLENMEVCELTRVALDTHQNPTSKIIALALRMLKKQSPGLRLVVSFADPYQEHLGVVYQASNWIYSGESSSYPIFIDHDGCDVFYSPLSQISRMEDRPKTI